MRIGVLASGSGTILEAMLDRALPVAVVVVDRPCGAVEIAERAGVEARVVEREDFGPGFDRVAYSKQIVDVLHEAEVDLVAMAGFGTDPRRARLRRVPRAGSSTPIRPCCRRSPAGTGWPTPWPTG